jgi:hypothetical protein
MTFGKEWARVGLKATGPMGDGVGKRHQNQTAAQPELPGPNKHKAPAIAGVYRIKAVVIRNIRHKPGYRFVTFDHTVFLDDTI